jgi:PAS domain S-box-containing protein
MADPIRVLIVEDAEPDARLMVRELRRADYEPTWERVETPEAMRAALERQPWDVILSDYKMPHFSGPAALALLQEMDLDLPFIIVSGTIGEETAVDAMHAGAHDYLLKNNLARLGPSIAREMREAEVRCARRQAEADLQLLNRGLRVLSSVNQAMLRATAEEALLQQVCDIAVHEGGYQMVWVGFAQNDPEKTVCPVCSAGHDENYLKTIQMSWDAAQAAGRGPTGTAIRTGQPAFARDITEAPDYAPWREEALKRGYRSSVSLPLVINNRVIGALNLYGPQPDAFPPDEVTLLTELADNLAFGINALRTRAQREQTEQALQESEARLRTVLATLPVGVFIIEADGRIIETNEMVNRIWGGTAPFSANIKEYQVYRGRWVNTGKPVRPDEWAAARAVTSGESSMGDVIDIERFDGVGATIINSAVPLRDHEGRIMGAVVAIQDISELRQTQQTLERERAFYRLVIDTVPNFIGVKDWESQFVLANKALGEVYGVSPEELLGKSDADFNPNLDEVAWFHHDDQEVIRTRETKYIPEEKVTDSAGRVRWLETVKVPLINPDGSCTSLLLASTDITRRKKAEDDAEREREFLATGIDILPIPILFIAPDREIIRANRASHEILAVLQHQRWRGLPLLSPDARTEIPEEQRPTARALRGERVTAVEALAQVASGGELPVLMYASPIYEEERLVAAVIAIQDITALKEADRAKNQFLNVISHEMRTPLTAILGWAQLAEDDPTLNADALHAIHQSAQLQQGVLERLILLSRILTGKLTLQRQPADLWVLADQVATASQLCAQERQVTLRCNPPAEPLPVSVDPKLMRQAMQEMLDNALKYTAVGGQVTVSATRMEDQAVVAVLDTGQGIALENLPKLWKPFQQVVREESLGGLGIGLVLLRGIVEAHGGQVFIVSPGLEQGSTFSISIALVLPLPGPPDTGAKGGRG